MTVQVSIDREKIIDFCRRWKVTEFALFGSVLREDFGPKSDIDVLISFSPDARRSLFELVRMEEELKELLGRDVDLVTRSSVEQSENYIRRKHILGNLETVYEA